MYVQILYHFSSVATEQPNYKQLSAAAHEGECFAVHADLFDVFGKSVPTLTVHPNCLKEKQTEETACHKEHGVASECTKK